MSPQKPLTRGWVSVIAGLHVSEKKRENYFLSLLGIKTEFFSLPTHGLVTIPAALL
jgi:hypothetical protein